MTDPYPLQWPVGRKRWQGSRKFATFKVREAQAVAELHDELEAMKATDVVISSNRKPYSRSDANPDDPGVAVYFTRNGRQLSVACDKWNRLEHNIRAVGLAIAAMRSISRWGTEDMEDTAFNAFAALPEAIVTPPPATVRPWHEVLEVSPTASIEIIEAAYRSLARRTHPDQGGSEAAFRDLNRALREAKAARS